MRTITFYSYKGGVGRSLLVANAAKYLSMLGKKVFALDLDLEAPGLHYKFELGDNAQHSGTAPGLVNILTDFLRSGALPDSLMEYAEQVKVHDGAEAIYLMRAGTAPQADYWRILSQLNWHELFYGAKPVGALFFLELKERIRREFNPDFLLIDASAGITEMGGIATVVLADTLVCLSLASAEHLEGIRAVIQAIRRTTSSEGATGPSEIIPVLSRLPVRKDADIEDTELDRVSSFLNTSINGKSDLLDLGEVRTLHSDPLLDSEEQLLVGSKHGIHDSPLLRDYLMLFSKIIPAEDLRPHVGQLIQRATSRLLDDPDSAQRDLEVLTTYCPDQEAYRALIKLYRLRKAPIDKLVATAALMWQFRTSNAAPDQLLLDIIKEAFGEPRASDVQKKYAEFAEIVWRSSGMKDIRIGMTVVSAYLPERLDRGIKLLSDYTEQVDPPSSQAVARLIDLLRIGRLSPQARSVVEQFKKSDTSPEFQTAWGKLVLDRKDSIATHQLLQDPMFLRDLMKATDPVTLYRLLKLEGDPTSDVLLTDAFVDAATSENLGRLRDLAEVLHEEGRLEELSIRVGNRIPDHIIERITTEFKRRGPRQRRLFPSLKE